MLTHHYLFRPYLQFSIPSYWPRKFKPGEKIIIEAKAYKKLKDVFTKSVGMPVLVMDIKEICNEENFDNFKRLVKC